WVRLSRSASFGSWATSEGELPNNRLLRTVRWPARHCSWPLRRLKSDRRMILPKQRDPRFITVRRGGTLLDEHHHLLATWAADCAEHVLQIFEQANPDDDRPRRAIELTRAWVRGEIRMK